MERKLKFHYSDGMDLLNALEGLAATLPAFGVELEILDGGDGYEEVRLRKKEDPCNTQTTKPNSADAGPPPQANCPQ